MPVACPSIEHCPLRCEAGLQRDERGCFQCECVPASRPEQCPTLSAQNCDKYVPKKESCTKTFLQHFLFFYISIHFCGYRFFCLSTIFRQCAHGYAKDAAGCVVCKCAKCPPLHQCMKHCLYGFESNSVGCPVCKCRGEKDVVCRLCSSDNLPPMHLVIVFLLFV